MVTIIFTEDFAGRKAGEEWECDSMLASHLVHVDKVAKYKIVKGAKTKFDNLNPEM
jgi:hypothetical protein